MEGGRIMSGLYTPGKIRTFTGKYVDPFNLQPEDIDIMDIAHALSNQCRFAGHTKRFFSVAQHCVQVTFNLERETKIYGLLHDASEAYLIDLPTPIKQRLPEYQFAENRAMNAVATAFGLDALKFQHPDVKMADRMALEAEWDMVVNADRLNCFAPELAKAKFLEEYHRLNLK
jgi:5'-deoxynucleotidase YfbR-like HD superfamily hydrolase